jgi:hypothetical protein
MDSSTKQKKVPTFLKSNFKPQSKIKRQMILEERKKLPIYSGASLLKEM